MSVIKQLHGDGLSQVLAEPLWPKYFLFCARWNITFQLRKVRATNLSKEWSELAHLVSSAADVVLAILSKLADRTLTIEELDYLQSNATAMGEYASSVQFTQFPQLLEEAVLLVVGYDHFMNLLHNFITVWLPVALYHFLTM